MSRRVKQVFNALKEHTFVSYAKIATAGGFCDVEHIITMATAPDDLSVEEKYIHELLKIFSISPSACRTFTLSFVRRFDGTHTWRVALKCLLLVHRLLRSAPENSTLQAELLSARTSEILLLNPCRFRDDSSSSASMYYTTFVISYAELLDEALNYIFYDRMMKEGRSEGNEILEEKMKGISQILETLPPLQSVIDRVMCCRPAGGIARSFLVRSVMRFIIRDSFLCYTKFKKEIVVAMENLLQLPYRSCVTTFGIYKKAAEQADQLCEFYEWCKSQGFCGLYEYPLVDKIPQIQIDALENFLNGMWQLTESSSSQTSSPNSSMGSSTQTEDDQDRQLLTGDDVVLFNGYEEKHVGMKIFDDHEEKPLIQLEDDNNDVSWETLLEASLSLSKSQMNDMFLHNSNVFGHGKLGFGDRNGDQDDHNNTWQIQPFRANALNSFCQPWTGAGSVVTNNIMYQRTTVDQRN